ncbi:lysoplasmalogenase [Jatrophihabitans cynanchi]|jgi:uncharacterized membrane protein YhhN|uniref:Lysoplasmalogenase n=1 Tax=Jatrophihabitans cynanchi TaxID=2944128 RepID=A0ABY7K4A6_9ACTN|nr:lysoplasmalogenase [Jatrophihabitans sp. SB3-54]WAX58830.1 lysoplasmalogenase [Jatrophihabitans sp. SB3-54]
MTIGLLLAAAIVAVGDWAAVGRRYFRIEYLLKPLTLVLLIAAAAAADLGAAKVWVLAALAFSLAGDVALVCSDRAAAEPDSALLIGLGSFLLGHVCYLIAFARHGVHGLYLLAGLLVVAGAAALSLPQVLAGARRTGGRQLAIIVAGYAVLLAAMAVFAVGTGTIATALGGLLFLASDTVLGHDRFVRRVPRGPLLVIVSYHAAQLLIVIGLLR